MHNIRYIEIEKTLLQHGLLKIYEGVKLTKSGFSGLDVACWPLEPKFVGSNLAEAIGFFRAKNPQHAFLRKGSKVVDHMS
jgi:hypothetical protein